METERREDVREETRQEYSEPKLEEWGSVAELTQTGATRPGGDAKSGSKPSQGV